MYIIYKAQFENDKVYIGITDNLERRISEHKRGRGKSAKSHYPFYLAIEKYGFDSIVWSVLEEVESLEEAKELEVKYVEEYDSFKRGGYNATKGGDYGKHVKLSDEDVEEIKVLLKAGELRMIDIAKLYKVTESTISMICSGHRRGNRVDRKRITKKGSNNGSSKLTEDLVSEIKKELIKGTSRKELREKYNVSKANIQAIAVGRSWSHVEPKIPMKKQSTKMTKEKLIAIKKNLEEGFTSAYVQEKFSTSPNTVVKIKKGFYDDLE